VPACAWVSAVRASNSSVESFSISPFFTSRSDRGWYTRKGRRRDHQATEAPPSSRRALRAARSRPGRRRRTGLVLLFRNAEEYYGRGCRVATALHSSASKSTDRGSSRHRPNLRLHFRAGADKQRIDQRPHRQPGLADEAPQGLRPTQATVSVNRKRHSESLAKAFRRQPSASAGELRSPPFPASSPIVDGWRLTANTVARAA